MLTAVYVGAQSYSTLRVVDSLDGIPVPFALVVDETTKRGIIADESGTFKLLSSDSLHFYYITGIGYDTVHFRQLNVPGATLHLPKKTVVLDTIAIYSTQYRCLRSLGYSLKKSRTSGSFNFKVGSEVAVYMPNVTGDDGLIQNIRFYIATDGYPKTKFRAKLYSVDTANGQPGHLLVESNIILCAENGNEWVELDITNLNLALPSNGFFVAMEWLPDSKYYEVTYRTDTIGSNGQSLGAGKAGHYCATWIKSLDTGWVNLSSFNNGNSCLNAMIGSDVILFCDDPDSKR